MFKMKFENVKFPLKKNGHKDGANDHSKGFYRLFLAVEPDLYPFYYDNNPYKYGNDFQHHFLDIFFQYLVLKQGILMLYQITFGILS